MVISSPAHWSGNDNTNTLRRVLGSDKGDDLGLVWYSYEHIFDCEALPCQCSRCTHTLNEALPLSDDSRVSKAMNSSGGREARGRTRGACGPA